MNEISHLTTPLRRKSAVGVAVTQDIRESPIDKFLHTIVGVD